MVGEDVEREKEDEDDGELESSDEQDLTIEERRKKKAAMKNAFNAEYDGNKASDNPEEEENHYANIEALRAQAGTQAELNKDFAAEDDAVSGRLSAADVV